MQQPYELPEFYTPWPARLNPNLAAARIHTKAWAYEMGILGPSPDDGPEIWSERKFDAMDYALLCAYGHPDTPGAELNLLCDWYVWLFFFDDHFLETYKHSQDIVGAKAYIARLPWLPVSRITFGRFALSCSQSLCLIPNNSFPGDYQRFVLA